MSGKKFLTPRGLGKNSPTNVQWSCQPFRGWEKKRIWHLSQRLSSAKWLARVHNVLVFKTKVLHFKIENTPIKDTNEKRKFKRMLSFFFCGQTKAFHYEIVFRGIQPCFLKGGSDRLACFEPTKAARFLKALRYIPYSMIKEKYFFQRGLLYL